MVRKLHIGAEFGSEGWEVLNITPAPHVDHVCNANDLSQFRDRTFAQIYASHVLEHFDYMNALHIVLREWLRVLEPGGKLYVSVPDLDTLAGLVIDKDRLTVEERYFVMRMIFGGHMDEHDFHLVGLNEEFLSVFLRQSGYVNVRRVKEFGLFEDTSSLLYKGILISLNMIAEKAE